jgi:hypothetical protein
MSKKNSHLSPKAGKEIRDELSKPAADTEQRRKTFRELKENEERFRRQGLTLGDVVRKSR